MRFEGQVTNDTFIALRRGLTSRFKLPVRGAENGRKLRPQVSRLRRVSLAARKEAPFFPGNWRLIPKPEIPEDLLDMEERRKDRARLLLDRYGIVFRELLYRERPRAGRASSGLCD
jgi:ATP-dependent Lhr-like helicase